MVTTVGTGQLDDECLRTGNVKGFVVCLLTIISGHRSCMVAVRGRHRVVVAWTLQQIRLGLACARALMHTLQLDMLMTPSIGCSPLQRSLHTSLFENQGYTVHRVFLIERNTVF